MRQRLFAISVFSLVLASTAFAQTLMTSLKDVLGLVDLYMSSNEATQSSAGGSTLQLKDPVDPKAFSKLVVRKEYYVKIADYEVNVSDRLNEDGSWNDLMTSIIWNFSATDLKMPHEMYQTMIAYFGEPAKVVDYGFLDNVATKGASISSIQAEWKRGTRRLWFSSENIILSTGSPMPMITALQVSDIKLRADLVDLVYLKASFKWLKNSEDGTQTPYKRDPIFLIVDFNSNRLLGANWNIIGDILEVSPGKIVARWGGKDSKNSITLDRYVGTFILELIGSNLPGGKQSAIGVFEKLEPQKAKVF